MEFRYFGLKAMVGLVLRRTTTLQRGVRDTAPQASLTMPESLETRHLMAVALVGRDTSDPLMKENNPSNPQWNMEKVLADVAWTVYSGQPRNVVAVMDYGIDYLHEDFGSSLSAARGQLWDRALFGADPNIRASKRGRDEINNIDGSRPGNEGATKPNAGELWGNHAAGIIGALTNNALGVAGINWSVQMLSSKVLDGPDPYAVPGFNLGVLQRAVNNIRYLRDITPNNQQLIRAVAFGYSTKPGIDYGNPFPIWAQLGQQGSPNIADPTKGILVTVPAGDFGQSANVWAPLPEYYSPGKWDETPNPPDSGNYAAFGSTYNKAPGEDGYRPGSTDNVIVVGATDVNDRAWEGNSNRPRIDIYAPGVSIVSVGDAAAGKYQYITGTRQAAAHVAGAISLIYDAAAQHGKAVTYHEVRRAIIEGGEKINDLDRPRLDIVGALRYLGLDTRPNVGARSLAISGGAGAEGAAGQSSAVFKLTLSQELAAPLSVQVRIDDGTATAASGDYVRPANGLVTVVIPAGRKDHTFTVAVSGDRRIEADETIVATVVNPPAGLTITGGSASWTIVNDDEVPAVSLDADVTVIEGTGRGGTARVTARLSRPVSEVVSVFASMTPGSATGGQDYVGSAAPRMIVFRPNTVAQWIDIPIIGDAAREPHETFIVTLQSASNATLGVKQSATVTIQDDDAPVVSLSAAMGRALVAVPTTLSFTVSLSAAAQSPVTVSYLAIDGTAVNGPAGAGDFILPAGTLTFAAGERAKTITAVVNPRRAGPPYPRKFALRLSNPGNASLSGGLATLTAEARLT